MLRITCRRTGKARPSSFWRARGVSKSGSSESVEVRGLGQESASSGLRVRVPVRYVADAISGGTSYTGDAGRHRPLDCVVLESLDTCAGRRQCQGGPWLGCDLVCLPAAVFSSPGSGPARPPASTRPTVRQWFARPAKRRHRPACGRADGRTCHPSRRQRFVWTDSRPDQSTCARVLLDSIAERQRWHDQTAVGQAYRSGLRDLNL
jgi:hypothetical protein